MVNRNEIVTEVAKELGYETNKEVAKCLELIKAYEAKVMTKVAEGKPVTLQGFLSLKPRKVAGKEMYIHLTKTTKFIPEHMAVSIKALKGFKDTMNK